MSEVIFKSDERLLAHIVKAEDGQFYYIDTADTVDLGWETMAFACDESGEVKDWLTPSLQQQHETEKEASNFHNSAIKNIEQYL